jgi:hypothetical protein
MNKAITDGLVFMPPAFAQGLDQWSRGDGTPGSDSYDGAPNAAFVPSDADFGGCLELQKTDTVQKLRHFGQTPILPGCYLRVRARIKAVSGNLPSVRIAAWAGTAGEQHLDGVIETGPAVALSTYGEVVEISAIVGTGARDGVDMPWGRTAIYGHFGLDLTGPNGGVVRIDDIEIEDVTSVFLRDMLGWVDVRDFGALGDGVTDDSAAFEAADTAAQGLTVKVPAGSYFLADSVTFENRVVFEGTVTMPDDKILSLTKNFDLPAYIDAFGDEVLAFKKAFQALLNNSDHESLDLGGRRISVFEPIDMQAAVANRNEYAQRRHIRNGQFYVEPSSAWDTELFTSLASYNPNNPLELTNVANVANIPVGALVEGGGVGREVYVREKNVAQQRITLSMPLYDAAGTQNFTFRRFKYILDFSGFEKLSKFSMSDIEFQCRGRASGIMLAPSGLIFHVKDCFFTAPLDRGLTSPGLGCQGMLIDRCQFLSNETAMRVQDRVSIALNANANDVKLRDNRITHFRHFAVLGGTSSIIAGNHWFQGDDEPEGVRTAGLILTSTHNRATITGNYIDNCSIEWSNEHDPDPGFSNEFSFSGLNISDNIFQAIDVAPWFRFFVVKPHGAGHFISGLNMCGNIFRAIRGNIDRVEHVDTSFADLDYSRMRNITVTGNMFNSVQQGIMNPAVIVHEQNSAASTWTVDCAGPLPFGGYAQTVEAVVARGAIRNGSNATRFHMPHVTTEQGPSRDQVTLSFAEAVTGTFGITVRIDN